VESVPPPPPGTPKAAPPLPPSATAGMPFAKLRQVPASRTATRRHGLGHGRASQAASGRRGSAAAAWECTASPGRAASRAARACRPCKHMIAPHPPPGCPAGLFTLMPAAFFRQPQCGWDHPGSISARAAAADCPRPVPFEPLRERSFRLRRLRSPHRVAVLRAASVSRWLRAPARTMGASRPIADGGATASRPLPPPARPAHACLRKPDQPEACP
jgi:hypothetical protein